MVIENAVILLQYGDIVSMITVTKCDVYYKNRRGTGFLLFLRLV